MKIDVEELRAAHYRRSEIDKTDIHSIEWYENGVKLEFTVDELNNWAYMGKGNSNFVLHHIDNPNRICSILPNKDKQ